MNNTWKTGAATPAPKAMRWPTPAQWGKQLGLILIIGLLWGGLLVAVWQLTAAPATEAQASPGEAAASAPTETPTPPPAPTATSTPTPPPPTETAPPQVAAPVDEPASPATHPPSLEPTNTPEPPSPTPLPVDLAPAETAAVSFANDVLPIFEDRCVKCHGGEETEEGLVLTNYEDALAGSWNGTVIEPGNVADSFLIEQIEKGEMPKKEPRLLPAQIRLITEWIAAGAPNN